MRSTNRPSRERPPERALTPKSVAGAGCAPPYNRQMVEGRRARFWATVLLLASAGSALVFDHTRLDSPTMDEPFHTLAAAEYAIAGTYYANLEHPPLVKLLSGFAIRAAGGRAPKTVSYTHLRAHETRHDLVCRLLL